MGKLPVSRLCAGMVLAEDAVTAAGRFLMPKGTRLEKSHLATLAGWGLAEVAVEESGEATTPAESGQRPQARDFLEAALETERGRFAFVDLSHEAGAAMFKLCVARAARALARAWPEAPPARIAGPASRSAGAAPRADQAPASPAGEAVPTPEELLREDPRLVSLPEVFTRIRDVLEDPRSSVEEAVDVIGKDQALSAKLLKLVNSAFYGRTMRAVEKRFPAKVDNLSRAVMIVGAKQLTTLALGVSVLPLFHDIPRDFIDMKSFWQHGIGCGVIARTLAARLGAANEESAFVAGLLHDIGRLVMYKNLPAPSTRALLSAREDITPLVAAERAVFEWDHAYLGGLLLRKWQYPAILEKMVRYHHDLSEPLFIEEPAIIHFSDFIVNALGVGTSGESRVPALIPEAWESLGIDPTALAEVVAAADAQIGDIMSSFFPEDTPTD